MVAFVIATRLAVSLFLSTLSGSILAAPAYIESFEDPNRTGSLARVLPMGSTGSWTGSIAGGAYVLDNPNDAAAVKYGYVTQLPGLGSAPSSAAVSVDVSAEFGSALSGAGLLYMFDPQRRTYWAFVLQRDGRHALFKRDSKGLQLVLAGRSATTRQDGVNRLTVQPAHGGVQLLVNGEPVGKASSPEISGSGVGLVAMGTGRFRFDDFSVTP